MFETLTNQTKTLEESITDVLAKEIQKEIDESFILEILVEGGWTKVPMRYNNAQHAVDVIDWCVGTFKENQWKRLTDSFVFRKKKDAEWFILRWL